MWGPCCRGMCALRKVFPIEGQLYQQKLVLEYLKNITKRYLENNENVYSAKKNP